MNNKKNDNQTINATPTISLTDEEIGELLRAAEEGQRTYDGSTCGSCQEPLDREECGSCGYPSCSVCDEHSAGCFFGPEED